MIESVATIEEIVANLQVMLLKNQITKAVFIKSIFTGRQERS